MKIALVMVERFGIKISSGHIDGTSLSVEGKYIQLEEKQKENSAEKVEEKKEDDGCIPVKNEHKYLKEGSD